MTANCTTGYAGDRGRDGDPDQPGVAVCQQHGDPVGNRRSDVPKSVKVSGTGGRVRRVPLSHSCTATSRMNTGRLPLYERSVPRWSCTCGRGRRHIPRPLDVPALRRPGYRHARPSREFVDGTFQEILRRTERSTGKRAEREPVIKGSTRTGPSHSRMRPSTGRSQRASSRSPPPGWS